MKHARIYKPSRTAMQSAIGKTKQWVLEFCTHDIKTPDPLMGWSQGSDTDNQIRLRFDTAEDAEDYAKAQGLSYLIQPAHAHKIRPRNYSENFRYIPISDEA